MKVYGAQICIDCRNFKHIMETRHLELEIVDIMANTTNLKEFLKLRDTSVIFKDCRDNGGIGIPCFVDDDKITLDVDEAMSWINQPAIAEEEIIEKRED